jgi:mRNA-degrading endonuclease toxin of MazEF toxin-antitoxin module
MVGVIAVRTGEVWLAHLDPTVGHEQGPWSLSRQTGLHALPVNMIVVVPLTSHDPGLVTQPRVASDATGLSRVSAG